MLGMSDFAKTKPVRPLRGYVAKPSRITEGDCQARLFARSALLSAEEHGTVRLLIVA